MILQLSSDRNITRSSFESHGEAGDLDYSFWYEKRNELAKRIIEISFSAGEGHLASSLSVLDALILLYSIYDKDNDVICLSKGHASLALYACLADRGMISNEELDHFCQNGSLLYGHPSSKSNSQIYLSTGSLGHGLPVCCGSALGRKISGSTGHIFCVIGDGEANEGTTWESALFASNLKLGNITCLMDNNKSSDRAIGLGNICEKFKSFGWATVDVSDGNNCFQIYNAIQQPNNGKPKFINLNTTKGKGCYSIENKPEWHHRSPKTRDEVQQLISNLY